MSSRVHTGPIASWWWTIDKFFVFCFLFLMIFGVVLSFAASPAVAERIGLDTFHFAIRQLVFTVPGVFCMIGVSFLKPRQLIFVSWFFLFFFFFLMVLVLFIGVEVKGARRWISFGGLSIQPSEFLKPFFVVICAWFFSLDQSKYYLPWNTLFSFFILFFSLGLLLLQPDFGQTLLFLVTWGFMFFLTGVSWLWIILLIILGVFCFSSAYIIFPHVAGRVDRFITGEGDLYQVNMGMHAFIRGGWFGVGPGEGSVKRLIPDSHADFIFAVAGEEYGIVLCMMIMLMFSLIVLRGLFIIVAERDSFIRCSVAGLVTIFGLQSIINMGVNLNIMPAKGMTLPFISYGGSSLIATAFSMGILLALTRKSAEKLRNPSLQNRI